jgi:hypothetical protein
MQTAAVRSCPCSRPAWLTNPQKLLLICNPKTQQFRLLAMLGSTWAKTSNSQKGTRGGKLPNWLFAMACRRHAETFATAGSVRLTLFSVHLSV